jgi:hypothetical protein
VTAEASTKALRSSFNGDAVAFIANATVASIAMMAVFARRGFMKSRFSKGKDM